MKCRTSGSVAWVAILFLVAGCSGLPAGRDVSSGPAQDAKAPASSAPIRFRLVADGLPVDGYWKSTPVLADVNKDGFLDLAIHPRLAKGPKVLLGNGKAQWTDSSQGLEMQASCGGGMQLADIDKDGNLDLVVADHCAGVFVFLGDGKGSWRAVTKGLTSEFSQSAKAKEREPEGFKGAEVVAVGDVNGDGFLDLVVSSSDLGGLTVYLGDGTGRNWKEVKRSGLPNGEQPEPNDIYYGGWAFDLQLVDMNGDGHLDLVASHYTGPRVWWGDGTGHFTDHSQGLIRTRIGGIYGRLAVGDLNRDGRPDLVVANNYNGAEAYLQNADGTWQGPIDVMPELKGGALAVALGDLDGDGNLDVVIGGKLAPGANYEWLPHGLWVRWRDGKGGFSNRGAETNLPSIGLEVVWGIKVVDVNGDGRPDIVVSTGGATGRLSSNPALPPGRNAITQKSFPAPNVQVWLNEGTARP